jgi:hypothetical protein
MAPAVMAALLVLAACGSPPDWPATAVAAVAADLASCTSAPRVAGQPPGPSDWPVYHRTGDRRGVDPAAAAARRVTPLWGARLDGSMFAEPLIVQGVVIEATEHDTVYALDEASGCLLWRTSLGAPFDVTRHALLCNNITPELGVTATPAVDPLTSTVYVVAFLDPGRYELDALDLGSGGGIRSTCPAATCCSSSAVPRWPSPTAASTRRSAGGRATATSTTGSWWA